MRPFDPVFLRLFVAVCEEQSGVRLLKRGWRGVVVTPAGEALLRYAREVLQSMDRMLAELSDTISQ